MTYPDQATHVVGWLIYISGIILLVSLLIGGCIRKGDDEDV